MIIQILDNILKFVFFHNTMYKPGSSHGLSVRSSGWSHFLNRPSKPSCTFCRCCTTDSHLAATSSGFSATNVIQLNQMCYLCSSCIKKKLELLLGKGYIAKMCLSAFWWPFCAFWAFKGAWPLISNLNDHRALNIEARGVKPSPKSSWWPIHLF